MLLTALLLPLLVVLAWWGIGRTLLALLACTASPPRWLRQPGIALAVATGLALVTLVQGVLLLMGAFGPGAAIAITAAGWLLACGCLWSGRHRVARALTRGRTRLKRLHKLWWLAVVVTLVGIGARLSSAGFTPLNPEDDLKGYACYPLKMLATGGFAGDPFNLRQSSEFGAWPSLMADVAAIGGNMLAWRMLDIAAGGLILTLAVVGMLLRSGGTRAAIAGGCALWTLCLAWVGRSANLAAATWLAVFVVVGWRLVFEQDRGWRNAVVAGTLFATAVLLKSTAALPLIVIGVVAAVWRMTQSVPRAIGWTMLATTAAGIVLVPWVALMHAGYGTWLWALDRGPFFARPVGTVARADSGASYYWTLLESEPLVQTGAIAAAVVLLAAVTATAGRPAIRWRLGALTLALAALPLFLKLTHVVSAVRYAGPFAAAFGALAIGAAVTIRRRGPLVPAGRLVVAVVAAAVVAMYVREVAQEYTGWAAYRADIVAQSTRPVSGRLEDMFTPDMPPAAYADVAATVPPGDTLLHLGRFAWLLPYGTNPVWVMDVPGRMGWPDARQPHTPVQIARALRHAGVDWLFVDMEQNGLYPIRTWQARLGPDSPYRTTAGELLRRLERMMQLPGYFPDHARRLGRASYLLHLAGALPDDAS